MLIRLNIRGRCSGAVTAVMAALLGASNSPPPMPASTDAASSSGRLPAKPIHPKPSVRIRHPARISGLGPRRSAQAPPNTVSPCCVSCRRPSTSPTLAAAHFRSPTKCTVTSGITRKNPPHISVVTAIRPNCAAERRKGVGAGAGGAAVTQARVHPPASPALF